MNCLILPCSARKRDPRGLPHVILPDGRPAAAAWEVYDGNQMRIARKHVSWYSKGLPGSAEFRATVNRLDDAETVKRRIREFYQPVIERHAA